MKLSKTQTECLAKAASRENGLLHTELTCGNGGQGAILPLTGTRKNRACSALRKCGMLELVNSFDSTYYTNSYAQHTTTSVWRITDAGRTLAASLKEDK